MWYSGIDQYQRDGVITTYGPDGPRVKQARVPNTPLALQRYFAEFPGPHEAVVESSGGWYWLADCRAAQGVELVLAPAKPAAPATLTVPVGTSVSLSVTDTITSRTAKAGDTFTAAVRGDVKDAAGRVVIPQGSVVTGSIVDVQPAPNPRETGTMQLAVTSITVRGTSYPLAASIDSAETVMKGRGIEGADAARVGAGAAAGAIAGRILGGNKKGTIIGGIVGAAAGAAVSAGVKDVDIVLPAGARLVISLTKPLSVKAS